MIVILKIISAILAVVCSLYAALIKVAQYLDRVRDKIRGKVVRKSRAVQRKLQKQVQIAAKDCARKQTAAHKRAEAAVLTARRESQEQNRRAVSAYHRQQCKLQGKVNKIDQKIKSL